MKLHLTTSQLLEQWQARRLGAGLRRDCVVEPTGAFATDEYSEMLMRSWYADLLATAPLCLLAPADVAADSTVEILPNRVALLTLPERAVRLAELRCSGWLRPAELVADLQSPLALAQENPYGQSTPARPVALLLSPRLLRVHSLPAAVADALPLGQPIRASHVFSSVVCVVEPDDGFFDLDSRALSTIAPVNI